MESFCSCTKYSLNIRKISDKTISLMFMIVNLYTLQSNFLKLYVNYISEYKDLHICQFIHELRFIHKKSLWR